MRRWLAVRINALAMVAGVVLLTIAGWRVDPSLGLAVLGIGIFALAWDKGFAK